MIASLPRTPVLRVAYAAYVALFLVYLALPLSVVGVFAFNASSVPALPWRGATLDWFLGQDPPESACSTMRASCAASAPR